MVGEGSGGSPEVCGKNRNKRRIHVAIVFADHEGMVGGNAPSLKHVGFSPLKSVGTYVGCGIVDYERVVRRACTAATNEKNLIRRNASEKPAEQNGQWENMRCKSGDVHFKYLLVSGLGLYLFDHCQFIDI